MISRYNKILCLMIVPIFLTGCWDYMDINKRSIDLSIGVDEVDNKLEFTGEIAKLQSSSSGSKVISQITDVYKYKSLGMYFEGSRGEYDAKNPGPDFSGAVRAIVFSKKYAEKTGMQSYINRLYYVIGFRNAVLVTVSKEPTNEFFNGKVKNDICIGYSIEDTIRNLEANGGALYKTVQGILSDIQLGDIGYLTPYITRDKDTIEYLGFAAMKDSKLVGTIKREESNGFLFILSKKPVSMSVIPKPGDEKRLLAIRTTLGRRSIKTSCIDKKINIYIDLKLDSQLQYGYSIAPLSKNDIKKLEDTISNSIKENINSAIKRSQKDFKCDVFGFARDFKAENPEYYREINWKEEYPKAVFNVNVETTIKNTNLMDPNGKKPN